MQVARPWAPGGNLEMISAWAHCSGPPPRRTHCAMLWASGGNRLTSSSRAQSIAGRFLMMQRTSALTTTFLCRPKIDADQGAARRKRVDGRVDIVGLPGCWTECDGQGENGEEQPGPAGMTERRAAKPRQPMRPQDGVQDRCPRRAAGAGTGHDQ